MTNTNWEGFGGLDLIFEAQYQSNIYLLYLRYNKSKKLIVSKIVLFSVEFWTSKVILLLGITRLWFEQLLVKPTFLALRKKGHIDCIGTGFSINLSRDLMQPWTNSFATLCPKAKPNTQKKATQGLPKWWWSPDWVDMATVTHVNRVTPNIYQHISKLKWWRQSNCGF